MEIHMIIMAWRIHIRPCLGCDQRIRSKMRCCSLIHTHTHTHTHTRVDPVSKCGLRCLLVSLKCCQRCSSCSCTGRYPSTINQSRIHLPHSDEFPQRHFRGIIYLINHWACTSNMWGSCLQLLVSDIPDDVRRRWILPVNMALA